MPQKVKDLTNIRIGSIVALYRAEDRLRKKKNKLVKDVTWMCKCDCGVEKVFRGSKLHESIKKINSGEIIEFTCGCWRNKYYGEASCNRAMNTYKSSSKKRGLEFKLTKEEFKAITQQNCYYCGIPPSNLCLNNHNMGNYVYNGIDRVDSNLGYIEGNCVPCCITCNIAKHTMGKSEFLKWVESVYNYSILNIVP